MPNAVGIKIPTPRFAYAKREWTIENVYKQMQKGGFTRTHGVGTLADSIRWYQRDASYHKPDRAGRSKDGRFPK